VRHRLALCALALSACAAQPPARERARDEERAQTYASRADAAKERGDTETALTLATRALVVRIARCGPDCPEVGVSFVQLGDLRWQNAQRGWAAQSYARALELFALNPKPYAAWIAATRQRLDSVCSHVEEPAPACQAR
jgi:hypothetical protein